MSDGLSRRSDAVDVRSESCVTRSGKPRAHRGGRAPSFDYTLGRLLDAQAALADEEACVSETQAFLGARTRPG